MNSYTENGYSSQLSHENDLLVCCQWAWWTRRTCQIPRLECTSISSCLPSLQDGGWKYLSWNCLFHSWSGFPCPRTHLAWVARHFTSLEAACHRFDRRQQMSQLPRWLLGKLSWLVSELVRLIVEWFHRSCVEKSTGQVWLSLHRLPPCLVQHLERRWIQRLAQVLSFQTRRHRELE